MTTRAANIQFLLSGMSNPTTGLPVAGGTVYFYEAGTSTQKYVWTEIAKTNGYYSASLDAVGAVQLYGEGNYKVVVKDSAGATVYTLDNVRIEYPYYGIRSVTQTGNQLSQDDFLLVDTSGGAVTINCLAAASWLRPLKIQRISGSASITVDPSSTETIDGASTLTISDDSIVEIISDGSNLRTAGFRSSTTSPDGGSAITVGNGSITMDVDDTQDVMVLYGSGAYTVYVSGGLSVLTGGLSVYGGITQAPSSAFTGGTVYPNTLKLNEDVAVTATATEINTACDGSTAKNSHTHVLASGATDVTATYTEINTVCDGSTAKNSHTHTLASGATDVTATYAEVNTGCDGIANPPIAGDSTAGRVLRRLILYIANGTNASTLKMWTLSDWNGDTIAETDNISGGTVGNFYYNSAVSTYSCSVLASGLTGNCVAVISAEIGHQFTTTPLTLLGSASGNNIDLYFYNEDTGANPTLDVLVDTGFIQVCITYITSA